MDTYQSIREQLQRSGYTIFNGVVSDDFLAQAKQQILQHLTSIPRIPTKRIKLDRLDNLSYDEIIDLHKRWEPFQVDSAIYAPSAFQMKFSQELRQEPAIYNLFAHLSGQADLRANVDAYSLRIPSNYYEIPYWNSNPSTWTFEKLTGVKYQRYLGLVTLTTTTFSFVPGSFTAEFHSHFMVQYNGRTRFTTPTQIHPTNDPMNLCSAVVDITIPAGSLIIWDEKLLRCAKPNLTPNIEAFVAISYSSVTESLQSDLHRIRSYLTGRAPPILSNGLKFQATPRMWTKFPAYVEEFQKIIPESCHRFKKDEAGRLVAYIDEYPMVESYRPTELTELGYKLLWGKSIAPALEDLKALEEVKDVRPIRFKFLKPEALTSFVEVAEAIEPIN